MSIQVIETGEIVEELTRVEAERLTARIADKLDAIADNLEQVLPLIGEALTRGAWHSLGYTSPTAYVSERFAKAFERLPVEIRRPVVAQLSAAGMSTRQIAPVLGVSNRQAAYDRVAGVQSLHTSPAPTTDDSEDSPDYGLPKSEKIIGSDGKQYTRPVIRNDPKPDEETPEPAKQRRRPITDQASDAGWEIRKATEKLQRIFEDDRLGRNKEEVAAHIRGHLEYATETLQSFLNTINSK